MTTDRRRVLYVHRTRGHGVEGIHIRGIADGLATRGYDVVMVAPSSTSGGGVVTKATTFRGRVLGWVSEHAPEFLFEFAELAYNVPASRAIAAALSNGDVAFVYERYAIFAMSGARLARRRGVPFVIEVNYTSRSPLVRKRTSWLKWLARRIDRTVYAQAAAIVVVSSTLRDELVEHYGIDAGRIVLSPNAADPAKFDPSTVPLGSLNGVSLTAKRVIGFVGSFAPWHGVDLLVQAFATVAKASPDAVLMLIGDGPERSNIESAAKSLGIADRVLFAGQVAHSHLAAYIARFNIAVMPDSNDYGSPMKIFEYMAMARAVVAPDYPPILDVIRHDKNGLVFKRRDVQALAAQLLNLCRDDIKAVQLGAKARETVLAERTWLHNVDMLLAALPDGTLAPRPINVSDSNASDGGLKDRATMT